MITVQIELDQVKDSQNESSGEILFPCDQCPKLLLKGIKVKTHKGTATGKKAFSCDQCPKSFLNRIMWKTHKGTQVGRNSFLVTRVQSHVEDS